MFSGRILFHCVCDRFCKFFRELFHLIALHGLEDVISGAVLQGDRLPHLNGTEDDHRKVCTLCEVGKVLFPVSMLIEHHEIHCKDIGAEAEEPLFCSFRRNCKFDGGALLQTALQLMLEFLMVIAGVVNDKETYGLHINLLRK